VLFLAEDIEYDYEEDDYLTDTEDIPFPAYDEDGMKFKLTIPNQWEPKLMWN